MITKSKVIELFGMADDLAALICPLKTCLTPTCTYEVDTQRSP